MATKVGRADGSGAVPAHRGVGDAASDRGGERTAEQDEPLEVRAEGVPDDEPGEHVVRQADRLRDLHPQLLPPREIDAAAEQVRSSQAEPHAPQPAQAERERVVHLEGEGDAHPDGRRGEEVGDGERHDARPVEPRPPGLEVDAGPLGVPARGESLEQLAHRGRRGGRVAADRQLEGAHVQGRVVGCGRCGSFVGERRGGGQAGEQQGEEGGETGEPHG